MFSRGPLRFVKHAVLSSVNKKYTGLTSSALTSSCLDAVVGRAPYSSVMAAKPAACSAIDEEDGALRKLSLDIWDHPELCFQEHYAHKTLTDYLESKGFQVERHYKQLETAFKATASSDETGEGDTTIGVMCEYDALPGIGHACGHNLIAIMGVAVSLGIKEALQKAGVKGNLVVLGCPAEEGGGGKIDLIKSGAYQEMDVAMMAHPSQYNLPKPIYVAMSKVRVTYHGKASHASSFPWDGVNALDAAVQCYQSVACMRQQMRPTWRVHGIFTKAGEQPNIIPETAELLFYARAPSSKELNELKRKLAGCFDGAALTAGCSVTYEFDPKSYESLLSNETLTSLYVNNGVEVGIDFEKDPTKLMKQGGSTDMGNVSRVLPSIHPKYSVRTEVAAHTTEFRDIVRTQASHDITIQHAKALAMAAIDVYNNPSLVPQMREELKRQLQQDS